MKCVRESGSFVRVYQHVSEQASQCNLLQERALGLRFCDKVLVTLKIAKRAPKLIFKGSL